MLLNNEFRIYWRHKQPVHSVTVTQTYGGKEVSRTFRVANPFLGESECIIERLGATKEVPAEPVVTAVARCHPFDNFSKIAGRKTSLRHAMRKLGWSHEQREATWKAMRDQGIKMEPKNKVPTPTEG